MGRVMNQIRRGVVEAALHLDTAGPADIVSFSTDVSAPAKSVLAAFSPIQDLHGYSNPWPAGGGKNLIDQDTATIYTRYLAANPSQWVNSNDSASFAFPCLPSTSYMVSVQNSNVTIFRAGYIETELPSSYLDSPTVYDQTRRTGAGSIALTTSANATYIIIQLPTSYIRTADLQIELGSTATSFAPYSNICPISGRTGLTAYRTGVNLINIPDQTNISVKSIGDTYDSQLRNLRYKPNTQYTFSCDFTTTDTSSSWGIRVFYTDGTSQYLWVHYRTSTGTSATTDASKSVSYIIFARDANFIATVTSFQLEIGSSASAFKPYQGATYPVDWSASAGTVYGGTVDVVSGVLTVDMAYALLNDSTKWTIPTGVTTIDYRYEYQFTDRKTFEDSFTGLISSYLPANSGASSYIRWAGASNWYCGIRSSSLTLEQIQQDATAGKIAISYPLATPQTYQLTPTQIDLLKGTNNLWQSENGDMTVGYWLHG